LFHSPISPAGVVSVAATELDFINISEDSSIKGNPKLQWYINIKGAVLKLIFSASSSIRILFEPMYVVIFLLNSTPG